MIDSIYFIVHFPVLVLLNYLRLNTKELDCNLISLTPTLLISQPVAMGLRVANVVPLDMYVYLPL